MHFAAYNGHVEVVKVLLAAGAEVNAQDWVSIVVLMYCSICQQLLGDW